jgi:hypothetical protein
MKPNSIKSTVFIVLVLMGFSCANKQPSGNAALSAGNKLWQLERLEDKRSGIFTYYRFEPNGRWLVYRRSKSSKMYERVDMGDIQLIESWKIVDDSVINIGGKDYKIISLNDTSLSYENRTDRDTIRMHFRGDKL